MSGALKLVLYFLVPSFAASGQMALFVLAYCIILTMYGGGFATVPAYLADMFGTAFVGGIHGRLLTAWAAAGVAGPVLVNYIRAYEVAHGVAKADAYTMTVHIMAVLLVIGIEVTLTACTNRLLKTIFQRRIHIINNPV